MGGPSLAVALAAAACASGVLGQGPGTTTTEGRPELLLQNCGAPGGCSDEPSSVTLDAQWRWLHDEDLRTCMEGGKWNKEVCKDPKACADACVLEGIGAEDYGALYGVRSVDRGLELGFVTTSDLGRTVGSRLYVMENDDTYKLFQLKNREIAFDVDVSTLPCGLNAAMYLVEMDAKGGLASSAGAKYGTGYCDAQCPHLQKFIDGEANLNDWDPAKGGHWASCCPEMDLYEANSRSMAFTAHPCSTVGPQRVAGTEAGDDATGDHYMGVCDKDGCDFNPYRLGEKDFFGPGGSGVDSKAPFTVVTQFLTSDETDAGELVEIRQVYVQGGKAIESPNVTKGIHGNSLTPSFCDAEKELHKACRKAGQDKGPYNKFKEVGGLGAMGEALSRGMVLVLSLWDDPATGMRWLDSSGPDGLSEDLPGVLRGPCSRGEGDAAVVEDTAGGSTARFSNIKYGTIGSTTPGVQRGPLSPPEEAAPQDAEAAGGDAPLAPEPPEEAAPQDAVAEGAEAAGGHDCANGDRAKWHREKQDWCCANAQIACPEELPSPPAPEQPEEAAPQDAVAEGAEAVGGDAAPAPEQAVQAPLEDTFDGWTCYLYENGEGDDEWCQGVHATSDGQFEYAHTPNGELSLCGGCLCCQRPVAGAGAPPAAGQPPAAEEPAPPAEGQPPAEEPAPPAEGQPPAEEPAPPAEEPAPLAEGQPPADEPPTPPHDCGNGDRAKWHREKQDWCCANAQIACPEELPPPPPPHDCGNGDHAKWHREKQEWCCANAQIACPEELAGQPPVRLYADAASGPGGGEPAPAPLAAGGARAPSGTAGALVVLAAAVAASAAAAAALRARRPGTPADAHRLLRDRGEDRSPEDGEGEAPMAAFEE